MCNMAWSKRKADIFFAPPDVGTFMHAVIEKFSRMVAKRNISWRDLDRDWCSEKVSEIVDEMLEKMQGSELQLPEDTRL